MRIYLFRLDNLVLKLSTQTHTHRSYFKKIFCNSLMCVIKQNTPQYNNMYVLSSRSLFTTNYVIMYQFFHITPMCFGYHQFCNISSHVCQPAGAGVIQTVSNVTSGRDCPLLCRNHRRCMFSTFTHFRGEPKCYLLSSCDVKVR